MLKRTVNYEDFNGDQKTKDCYFNFTEAELAELELSVDGGLSVLLEKIIHEQDRRELIGYFKKLVLMAYGEKSADGDYFLKTDEIRAKFESSAVYASLFMEFATDANAAAEFVNGILPKSVRKNIEEENKA